MSRQLVIDGLLCFGVASMAFTLVGLWMARDVYERLHYLSPGTSLGVVAVAAAVVVQEAFSRAGINALLIALIVFFSNPVLTHATARAARIRQLGDWRPKPEERIEVVGEDEVMKPEQEP